MSDTGKKPGPIPQYEPFPAQLRPDQITAIRTEAELRGPRQGNAVLRDVVDFWLAHRSFFSSWVASRSNIPPETK
jgi:hypothetical protein